MEQCSKHPVIQLMKDRTQEGSKPWNRTDGAKVGVVVEGGALRAVATAAELVALQKMGLTSTIDAMYGESIGAGNAAYFLQGLLDRSIATYWELVNNLGFFNPLRPLVKGNMLSIPFLMKQLEANYPYNYTPIADSGVTLNVLLARADKPVRETYQPLIRINQFDDSQDLLEALTAAVWMPFFSGDPYPYRDMRCWDGGIIDKFPIQTAIDDGCSHILALLASPFDYAPKDPGPATRFLVTNYFKKYNPDLGKSYLATQPKLRNTMELLRKKQMNQDGPPYIATIAAPVGISRLSTFEMRGKVLRQTANLAEKVTYQTFA